MISPASQRGMTLLEVVLSVALLAGIASGVAAAFGGFSRIAVRQTHRLNAYEVAHRVILQYLNGPDDLPPSDLPQEQGAFKYGFVLGESVLIEDDENPDERVSVRRERSIGTADQDERLGAGLIMVTVRVHLWPEPGVPAPFGDEPLAELTRIYDPYTFDQPEDVFLRRVIHLLGEDDGGRILRERGR